MPRIWTYNVLLQLFELLVQQYGPHDTWEKRTLPGHGRDEDYREFLEKFSRKHGANSGAAVSLKVEHAIFRHGGAYRWGGPGGTDALRSLAAAEEAGFIDTDLPKEDAEQVRQLREREAKPRQRR